MNHAITNKDKALHLLRSLYENGVAQATLDRIWLRLPNQSIQSAAPRNHCMIISYADTITAEGEAPLATLRRFLHVNTADGRQGFGWRRGGAWHVLSGVG